MKKQTVFFYIGIMLFLVSCKIAPKAIQYGTDVCHSCQMTIVEKTHAAEIVTKKVEHTSTTLLNACYKI